MPRLLRVLAAASLALMCTHALAEVPAGKDKDADWVLIGETSPLTREYFIDRASIRRTQGGVLYRERCEFVDPGRLLLPTGESYEADARQYEADCGTLAQRLVSITYLDGHDEPVRTRNLSPAGDMRLAQPGSVADVSIRYVCRASMAGGGR